MKFITLYGKEKPLRSPHKYKIKWNGKIAIEVQGAHHLQFVKHFHKTRANFVRQIKRDTKKLEFCEINSIKLIEIYPDDELSDEFFAKLLG